MDSQRCLILSAMIALSVALLISFLPTKRSDLPSSVLNSQNKISSIVDPELGSTSSPYQTYIVYLREPEGRNFLDAEDRERWHKSFLPSHNLDYSGEPRLIYSYAHVISGFAARLTIEEVKAMSSLPGFLEARPSRRLFPRTTLSPAFLGLQQGQGFWKATSCGKGMIIGMVDFGIHPHHPSFGDDGMPEPPPTWHGKCYTGFPCNKKIIGAMGFRKGEVSPEDEEDSHGTNTASIAAGNFVRNAAVLGEAKGTASGTAPCAHLAIYKVCSDACYTGDMLAGLDRAIDEKVDVISISIGGGENDPFYDDEFAQGSFAAIDHGIFVSACAGNDGPEAGTVENDAPWMLTVGASTIDRSLKATVELGDGQKLIGESAYQDTDFPSTTWFDLVYPGATGDAGAKHCDPGSLDKIDVKGKIVMCYAGGEESGPIEKGEVVKEAGGKAMILMNQEEEQFTTYAEAHVLPASRITFSDSEKIINYFGKAKPPRARIKFERTSAGIRPAPAVGAMSSRGPSAQNGGILKPDIIGPGINIVVATLSPVGPDRSESPKFDMVSGTSFATPHLSGIAALLKKSHNDWSPAAIKSAIMTTAYTTNRRGERIADETLQPASLFAVGAGHVNPDKANDPGLVYDLEAKDYIPYLCGLPNYDDDKVYKVTQHRVKCAEVGKITAEQLNHPSISLSLKPSGSMTIGRKVKNVGDQVNEVYHAEVSRIEGVDVTVTPNTLQFSVQSETKPFDVKISAKGSVRKGSLLEGDLKWVSDKHVVRSPISVTII